MQVQSDSFISKSYPNLINWQFGNGSGYYVINGESTARVTLPLAKQDW